MSTAAAAQTPPGSPPTAAPAGQGVGDYARRWWSDVRAGELGSLPIIIGLVIIAIVFQSQNDRFLTSGNFVNLIVQAAAITTIGMGVVFVLLLGEIDLSVGYVSGVAGVLCALLLLPDESALPAGFAILAALAAGVVIGTLHGLLITKVGIPSFVVTLAGLLGWNGVVLLLIGQRGTVVLQDDFVIGLSNNFLTDSTALIAALVAVGLYAGVLLISRRSRQAAGLPNDPPVLLALRVAGLAVILFGVVLFANQDRGIPYVLVLLAVLFLFWTFVLNRTRFGRHVYAVGGNAEAARRAGINVDRIKIQVFAICSLMAALGGIILASRLRSVDPGAGGGQILLYSIAAAVIGGTSLFGGRGNIKSAVLGALVIASIDNGLGLLGLSSGTKFVVTGLVLLAAVTVDSVSRKGRAQSGRA
ncbi:MAG: ABC transporter permease [Solirubrobacterales bacterium]|nr:ABC transporter permease [Solirubrobacterales bacterium]